MSNKIDLKSISELIGMNFFIPSYQRGYRWKPQQVKDLLDDIQEFIDKKHAGFYCIQPLVVRGKVSEWEVIDGQQRLTTIYILLHYLDPDKKYTLEYQTRDKSKTFLESINESEKKDNIDFYHIAEAKNEIVKWFEKNDADFKKKFLDALLKDVRFIWYESVDEDPIKVFTRLNVGKIGLTNAELIKALFLNKSNFEGGNQRVKIQQNEIAMEWDNIEYTLQNDEFWMFLHEDGYKNPTRIDFIFDLIVEKNILKLTDHQLITIGTDEHRTFRYFYEWFKAHKGDDLDISLSWGEVKKIFNTFQEWFNDIELYHYVGFLVEKEKTKNGVKISEILENWRQTKTDFTSDYLYRKIKEKIGNPKTDDLEIINSKEDYRVCPILLLHNIQTVINQHKTLIGNNKYKLPVFYKFPFHLFKIETWNVEHIDSNTENPLDIEKEQKEWLRSSYEFVSDDVKELIKLFIKNTDNKNNSDNSLIFDTLWNKVIEETSNKNNKLTDTEKNQLWNFALLDESTNKGFGNAIFPAKRRVIIGKDQGKKISINDNLELSEKNEAIAFIPPCTKNVFLKYYNPATNNLREWDKTDAEAYLENIKTTLNKFLQ